MNSNIYFNNEVFVGSETFEPSHKTEQAWEVVTILARLFKM